VIESTTATSNFAIFGDGEKIGDSAQ